MAPIPEAIFLLEPAVYRQLLHTKNFLVKAYFTRVLFTVTDWEAEEYLAFGQILAV